MKELLIVLFIFQIHFTIAQEALFVSAENGLNVRSGPSKDTKRIGKLDYAEKIISFQNTNRHDEVLDDGVIITGEWFHITANNINSKPIEGYVFSGFLTTEKLKKKIKIKFEKFSVEFEHIALWDSEKTLSGIQNDTVKLNSDVSGSPENKIVKIKGHYFKKIELYQRFQNSITIMNEGPHCDLINWKNYYSHWEKIPFIEGENVFKTLKYSEIDRSQFTPIQIKELKNAVEEHCGEIWSKLLTEIENVTDYPVGISTNKIFIKIVITDVNNKISEKIIEFTIPMGC